MAYPTPGQKPWGNDLKGYIDAGDNAAKTASVPKSLVDAKGDLLVGTAADAVGRLAAAATKAHLFPDSTQSTGLRWGTGGETVDARYAPSANLNTLITPGFYTIDASATNRPTPIQPGGSAGSVHVFWQPTYITQRYVGGLQAFFRTSGDGGATWRPWIEERTSAPYPGNTITGTGSPEGAVTAPVGVKFIDTNATNGAVEWIKASGAGNTGWRVVRGDTGPRLVAAAGSIADMPNMQVFARRVNDVVSYWCRESAAGTAVGLKDLWTPTSGFRLAEGSGVNRAAVSMVVNAGTGSLVSGSALVAFSATTPLLRLTAVSGQRHYAAITDQTADQWPTTLPGTAA